MAIITDEFGNEVFDEFGYDVTDGVPMPSMVGEILLADGVSELLLADGASVALLAGGGLPSLVGDILLVDGVSSLKLANNIDHALLSGGAAAPFVQLPASPNVALINGITVSRPGGLLGRFHVSMASADDSHQHIGDSSSGSLSRHRQNAGHRTSPQRLPSDLRGFLRKSRVGHFLPAVNPAPAAADGGGGGGYVANAVTFDPNGDLDCYLTASGPIAADSPLCSWAGWALVPSASFSNGAPTFCNPLNGGNWIEVPAVYWNNPGDCYVHAISQDGNSEYVAPSVDSPLNPDVWVWLAGNVDTGHDPGARTSLFYIGDVNVPLDPANGGRDTGSAFDIPFTSFPGGGYTAVTLRSNGEVLRYSEIFVWPGQLVDWSVQATRRLLFGPDGKPVNPDSPSGAVATLGNPSMRFSGPANAYVNSGSGPSFTQTAGLITTAPTSPSD